MNSLAATGLGVAGTLAGIPVAAIVYSMPATGRVHLPKRWWIGGPARPALVFATAICTGAAAAIVGAVVPATFALPSFWLVAIVGVGLAIIDVRRRRLPFGPTGALWALCIGCFAVTVAISGNATPLIRAVTMGCATSAALLLVALAMPGQLGLGDVVFAGAITLSLGWLGWQPAALGLLTGLALQGAVALVAKLRRRGNDPIPMGPALVVGWLLAVVLAA